MTTGLSPDVLQDELAISLARAVAVANREARSAGVNIDESLVTIQQELDGGQPRWRINYGPKDYVHRRGATTW